MTPTQDRALAWRIAVHESGHAIIIAVLKAGTLNCLYADGGEGCVYYTELPNVPDREWLHAIHASAGAEAERQIIGDAHDPASTEDRRLVTEHSCGEAMLAAATPEVRRLVRVFRRDIWKLARVLLRRKALTGPQVAKVMGWTANGAL